MNWLPNSPPAAATPKKQVCPAQVKDGCKAEEVCTVDPHDTLGPLRGTTAFKCISGKGICGGFGSVQCKVGELCVNDPRMQW